MPFRNLETLECWLEEFRALGYPMAGSVRVIPQDGDGGATPGWWAFRLANASTPDIHRAEPARIRRAG